MPYRTRRFIEPTTLRVPEGPLNHRLDTLPQSIVNLPRLAPTTSSVATTPLLPINVN